MILGHLTSFSGLECVSRSVMSDSSWLHGLGPTRLLHPWDFPGKNTGVGCHSLLQGIFLTQGSNLGLLRCRQILPSEPSGKSKIQNVYQILKSYIRKYFTLRWEFLHKRVIYAVDSNNTPHFWTAYYVSGTVLYTECELYHSVSPTSLWLLTPFYSKKMEAQRE